jgi:hypothetical protein
MISRMIFLSFIFSLGSVASAQSTADSTSWPFNDLQHSHFLKWAELKSSQIKASDETLDTKPDATLTPAEAAIKFNVPSKIDLKADPIRPPTPGQAKEIEKTARLYFAHFGRDNLSSFLWSGVETGNTLTGRMDYRWNSLREAGFYDPKTRAQFIEGLKRSGIKNLRFGFSNHEIFKNLDGTWNEASWKNADDMIGDLTASGINLSLDLHHFGIESRFCVDSKGLPATYQKGPDELCDQNKYDPTKSFYLNPEWPEYFASFAEEAFRRYHDKVKAFTFINEPETVKGFNSGLWAGAFPGWQTPPYPTAGYYEAERAINIGLAAVKARLRIENYIRKQKIPLNQHPIFLHTEATVPKAHWPDFNQYIRYITSDLILGADWLMNSSINQLSEEPSLAKVAARVQWELASPNKRTVLHLLTSQSIWWGFQDGLKEQDDRRIHFFDRLRELRARHLELKDRFHQTMRSYTVLGIDYYAHNEEGLEPRPELYKPQILSGKRIGLYQTAKAYFERYQMPLMVTESGTPYYVYGARWHQQMLLECARLAQQGIPFLGYTIYPAIDTYGWEHAISRPKEPLYKPEGSLYNPSGILFLKDAPPPEADVIGFSSMQPKPFIFELQNQLKSVIPVQ